MSNIIDELELSVRTTNALKLMGDVHTLDDFMGLTMARVCAVRNAGRRTWNEIREVQNHLRNRVHQTEGECEAELRDEIAMHILPNVITACKNDTRKVGETHEQMFARNAYAMADAMIEARKTTKAKGQN
jgi:hypothetical protein